MQTYELPDARISELLEKLQKDTPTCRRRGSGSEEVPHDRAARRLLGQRHQLLLPQSEIRRNVRGQDRQFSAKAGTPSDPLARLVDPKDVQVIVLLYVATEHARDYLAAKSSAVWGAGTCTVEVVQLIPENIRLAESTGGTFCDLIRDYYDHTVFDSHFEKGETEDARYGYAGGGLPFVLHHNSPNNSIALLWSYEDRDMRGLFPRVQRHKEAT